MDSPLILAAIGLCCAIVGWIVFRASPRLTFVMWALTMFFVPVWIGATAGPFIAAITGVTLLAIASNLRRVPLAAADFVVGTFAVFVLVLFALRLVELTPMVTAVLEWFVPYVWGRIAAARLGTNRATSIIAGVAAFAAVLAIVEFITATNVFILLPALGPSFETWGELQERGGFLRAEGAFGHSIALGAALAMAAPFAMAARWRLATRVAVLCALAAASVVTFSRIGLVGLVLGIALSILVLPGLGRATRVVVAVAGAVGALVAVPFLSSVFLEAGEEASGSAMYRSGLFVLAGQVQPLGSAGGWQSLATNGAYLGYYADSVDNAVLVAALSYGAIPTGLVLVGLVGLAVTLLQRGRANPATIAVVTQLPAVVSVALITQYGMFLWFLAGLAVAWRSMPKDEMSWSDLGGGAVQPSAVHADIQRVRDDLPSQHRHGVR